MDGVLCNFRKAFTQGRLQNPNQPYPQSRIGFFIDLEPIDGSIPAVRQLMENYDVWILTRPSTQNLNSYTEKAYWLRKYFGDEILEKTIMSPDKSLVKGDYLIDDETGFGQTEFEGEFIHFGSKNFMNWSDVSNYFYYREKLQTV